MIECYTYPKSALFQTAGILSQFGICLGKILAGNEGKNPWSSSKFQPDHREVARFGNVSLVSPYADDDEVLSTTTSQVVGITVLYSFPRGIILANVLGLRSAIYFTHEHVLVFLGGHGDKMLPPEVKVLLEANNVKAFQKSKNCGRIGLIEHPQFAHYLLNSLSGISDVLEQGILPGFDELLAFPPYYLGDIAKVFPECGIRNHSDIQASHKHDLCGDSLVVHLCSYAISEMLISRIKCLAHKSLLESTQNQLRILREKHFPILWIGWRTLNRTWLQQAEAISRIIAKMRVQFPKPLFILAGFAAAEDHATSQQFAAQMSIYVGEIDELQSRLSNFDDLRNITGHSILKAVAWAGIIDCYLTPAGTAQHIPGWFSDVPGLVHTNSRILSIESSRRPGMWEREIGVKPTYVDFCAVRDLDLSDPLSDYNCDYESAEELLAELVEKCARSKERIKS